MDKQQKIIDYLYGQLNTEEQRQFEAELEKDENLQEEIKDLRNTLGLLAEVEDQEVIEPDFSELFQKDTRFKIPASVWTTLSVAASLILLMIVGYVTNFNVSYTSSGFRMAFNEPAIDNISDPLLTQEDVLQLIDAKLSTQQNHLDQKLVDLSSNLQNQLEENKAIQKEQFTRLANQEKELSDEQILSFINQLQEENRSQLANFFEVSARDQEVYMQSVLSEFSKFLQEQRMDDIQMLQANLLEMKTSSEEKQEETDRILASIITTVYNQDNNSIGR